MTLYIIMLIIALDSDIRKYNEFITAYCYECAARVTMLKAMNEWRFHGIALYGNDKGF